MLEFVGELPAANRGREARVLTPEVLEALYSRPKEWAVLRRYSKLSSARTMVSRLRASSSGLNLQFSSRGPVLYGRFTDA